MGGAEWKPGWPAPPGVAVNEAGEVLTCETCESDLPAPFRTLACGANGHQAGRSWLPAGNSHTFDLAFESEDGSEWCGRCGHRKDDTAAAHGAEDIPPAAPVATSTEKAHDVADNAVVAEIWVEMRRQRDKYNYTDKHDDELPATAWPWLLGQRVVTLLAPALRMPDRRRCLVELAAIACRAVEAHDRHTGQ